MTFNTEQLELLKEAEFQFKSSQEGWVKYANRALCDKVADIYFQATGQIIPKTWSCSTCVLNLFKRVGKLYFADKKELEEKDKASNEPEPLPPEESTIPKSKKAVANKNKK